MSWSKDQQIAPGCSRCPRDLDNELAQDEIRVHDFARDDAIVSVRMEGDGFITIYCGSADY